MSSSNLIYLDDWEVRYYYHPMAGFPLLYFRGKKYKGDKLIEQAWYSSWGNGIDENGNIITKNYQTIKLGTPQKDFFKIINILDFNKKENLALLWKKEYWEKCRYHPKMLFLVSNEKMPNKHYLEVEKLLLEEKMEILSHEEKDFLESVRNSNRGVGEWKYQNNKWYYRGEKVFED